MLSCDTAFEDLTLPVGADESGIDENKGCCGRPKAGGSHCRDHPAHRVPHQHRRVQSELLDEPHHIISQIVIEVTPSGALDAPCPLASGNTTSNSRCRVCASGNKHAPLPINPCRAMSVGLSPPLRR